MGAARWIGIWLACACLACESAATPTETIVVIDAEAGVRELTQTLHARVLSENGIGRFEHEFRPHWPVRLAVVPLENAKHEFVVSVEAKTADGSTLVGARVRAGFVEGAKRYLHVLLEDACRNHEPACDDDSTCRGGVCVPAKVSRDTLRETPCSGSGCRITAAASSEPPSGIDGGMEAGPEGSAGSTPEMPTEPEPPACTDAQLMCGASCVPRNSVEHCGACDHDCRKLPNVDGWTGCADGRCAFERSACKPGHGDCNGKPDDGCETELDTIMDCGACRTVCAPGTHCEAGRCNANCADGTIECHDRCVDPARDAMNCGGCGTACEADHVCQSGQCVPSCVSQSCAFSACRSGRLQCNASAPVCEAVAPLREGTPCGDGASCVEGRCTCGVSNGRNKVWEACVSDADCGAGLVCIDRNGNGAFFCKPLCDRDTDCPANLRCSALTCQNGKRPGVRACVEEDSKLALPYNNSSCCGGPGSAMVSAIGCADGTREAFANWDTFPSVAGCEAEWPLASMRDAPTGRACGNSLGVECSVPADACATGWHVCGTPPYGSWDVGFKLTPEECEGQPGRFAMALGNESCEPCDRSGKGAACCGAACTQSYGDCVFPQRTAWFGILNGRVNLCGAIVSASAGQGVMCCRGYPVPMAPAAM